MTSSSTRARSKSLVKGKAALQEEGQVSPRTGLKQPKKEGAHDGGFRSVWDVPFDLSQFPKELQASLVAVAPCLLGREDAVYDAKFFNKVIGLCNLGLLPKDVTNVHVPSELYKGDYTAREGANKSRYPMDKCIDPIARDLYTKRYMKVYSDVPNNKAFSLTFLCACMFYYQDKANRVDWASAAAKVNANRLKHAGNNPLKLGPPTLYDQLKGIVKECSKYISEWGGCGKGPVGGASGSGSCGGGDSITTVAGLSATGSGNKAKQKVE